MSVPHQIAVICQNQIDLTLMEPYLAPMLYRALDHETAYHAKKLLSAFIRHTVQPCVKFVDCVSGDTESIIATACREIAAARPQHGISDLNIMTTVSYSTSKTVLEVMHAETISECKNQFASDTTIHITKDNVNALACFMSLDHQIIIYTAVLLANRYTTDANRFALRSTTWDDILKVVRRRFYLTAMRCEGATWVKMRYQHLEYLQHAVFGPAKVIKKRLNFLKYYLVLIYMENTNAALNVTLTRLVNRPIHGVGLVLNETAQDVYTNLSCHEMQNIMDLAQNPMAFREIQSHELNMTSYMIVASRLRTLQPKCHNKNCRELPTIQCQRCMRIRYCSTQCQNQDLEQHTPECCCDTASEV